MRVLLFNRDNPHQISGGDFIQMHKTKEYLQNLGLDISTASPSNLPSSYDYDIIHLFNLQTCKDTFIGMRFGEIHNIPIVISPIFWDMRKENFISAKQSRYIWRLINILLGEIIAQYLYLRWQSTKAPFNSTWKIQSELLIKSQYILPNARTEAELIRIYFNLRKTEVSKMRVIPNGVDIDLYRNITENSYLVDKFGLSGCILQVGWIGKYKNQLGLIEALKNTPEKIVFIGAVSPNEKEYFNQCKISAEKRGNVLFIDQVPHRELPSIYASSSLHVLPSYRETPGLASLEAAAAGCRVVSTSIGTAKEYFRDLVLYCNPYEVSSIHNSVMESLSHKVNPKLRKHILENFSWQLAAEKTFEVYKDAIQN